MLFRSAIIPANHPADFTGLEGYFVRTAANTDFICNTAADIPLGVIVEGLRTRSSIITPNYGGVVKVKVANSGAGIINRGTYLMLRTDGTVQADSGTGVRVRIARALEAGTPNELIDAYLIEPIALV